jgi:hypothetical protein
VIQRAIQTHVGAVLVVHRQYQIEFLVVAHRDRTRLDPVEGIALALRQQTGADIRRRAGPRLGAGGIHQDVSLQAGLLDQVAHDALTGRRATDIRGADNKDMHHG